MIDPLETFAEALSVPAMLHMEADRAVNVLTVGPYASPMAKLALRYPGTVRVHMVGLEGVQAPRDRRVSSHPALADLPESWKADVVALAFPGDPRGTLKALQKHLNSDAIVVVAVDNVQRGRDVKDALKAMVGAPLGQVLAYREHTPSPALFLMASRRRFGRPRRPFPGGLKRLTPPYLDSLFSLAKDEYQMIFGETK